jgi:hypothetical protein
MLLSDRKRDLICYKTSFAMKSFLVGHHWKKSSKRVVKSQKGREGEKDVVGIPS